MDNSDIIAPIVNFAAVVGILVYAGRKPMASFLAQRSESIKAQIQESEAQAAEARKMLAEWQANRNAADAHAKAAVEDATTTLKKFKERTIASAHAEAERIKKEAEMM